MTAAVPLPRLVVMLRWIHDLDERLHRRIEDSMERRGILYPWWIPTTSFAGQLACVLLALLQRDALWPVGFLTLALPLVLAAPAIHFLFDHWLPWWLDGAGTLAAAALLLSSPTTSAIDVAPALIALVAAEGVARDGTLRGVLTGILGAGIIVVTALTVGLDGYGVYLLEVVLGLLVGAMLWWQMRALAAERRARASAWSEATTAERERIAREIHDLVAHSLSVSLLQVTGARHALGDIREARGPDETDAAVGEVDAALADAEQVGRRALADIRRTVSAMASGPTDRHALPGAAEIAALVAEFAAAGLEVQYDEQGDVAAVPDAVGLALYRIAQESLANVVRHGSTPGQAQVRFCVTRSGLHLRITNPMVLGRVRSDGRGSGLAGMQARATQLGATLHAGPDDGGWVVDVRLEEPVGAARRGGLELPCGRTIGSAGPAVGSTS